MIVTAVPTAGDVPLEVTMYFAAGPTTDVIVGVDPYRASHRSRWTTEPPTIGPEVNCTVAVPVASVIDVGAAKTPPVPVALQVTVWPAVATTFPLASSSLAVIVTAAPATGDVPLVVTRYFVGAPATDVIVDVDPASAPSAAVTM